MLAICRSAKTIIVALVFLGTPFSLLKAGVFRSGTDLEIGTLLSERTYEEPGVMKESGLMSGVTGALAFRSRHMLGGIDILRAEGTAEWGRVDYKSADSGFINGISDSMLEVRTLFGRELRNSGGMQLTTFAGFGYRRLDDFMGRVSSTGYDRQSIYWYSPLSIELCLPQERGWTIDGTVEYDFLISGMQTSLITQAVNSSFTYSDNLKNRQNDGYGLRASARFSKKIDAFTLAFEPWFCYWNIGNSEGDTIVVTQNGSSLRKSYFEPKNTTTQYGLKVSMLF
ncbi:MAG: hypothetical protein WCH05_01360 [Chlorobiaceae bacterium]